MLNAKVADSEELKKDKRDTYSHKIGLMVGSLEEMVEEESVQVCFDHNLIKWVQEMGS